MTNNAYRIIDTSKRPAKRLNRDPRCDGYERDSHRASFVYIIGDAVLCADCYSQQRKAIRARIDAFKAKAVA